MTRLDAVLADRRRPLFAAFPTMAMKPGTLGVETDDAEPGAVGGLRARSENQVHSLATRGVRSSLVRLPPSVHGYTRQGLITQLIGIARKKQVSAASERGRSIGALCTGKMRRFCSGSRSRTARWARITTPWARRRFGFERSRRRMLNRLAAGAGT